MSRKSLVLANRARIGEIAVSCNAERVALFGSTARGEDTDTSDCDFVVDFKPRTTLRHLAKMRLQLEKLLGCPVDIVSRRSVPCEAVHVEAESIPRCSRSGNAHPVSNAGGSRVRAWQPRDMVTRVQDCGLDIERFRRWATGNLVDNRNRGIFAEWLVGQALQAIDASEFRQEWDVWDLQYRHAPIEVKASGLSQYWSPLRRSRPSFRIAVPKQIWCKQTAQWQPNHQATRPAQVYVFCLHTSLPATNANVACPYTWEFWVISGRALDARLGAQQTVGLATLDQLTEDQLTDPIRWDQIKEAVDRLID